MTLRQALIITSCLLLPLTACSGPEDNPQNNESDMMVSSNQAPIADPGTNFDAVVGERTEVSAAASSDPDGDIITVEWTIEPPEGSSATLEDPTAFRTGFVPDIEGIYKLTLVVSDGRLESDPVPVFVRATPGGGGGGGMENRSPVANAGEDATYFLDQTITLDGSGSTDPDNDPLTFIWTLIESPDGSSAALSQVDAERPDLSADLPGIYQIELVVNDGEIESAPDRVLITVQDVTSSNTPPVAGVDVPANIIVGQQVSLDGSPSFDADGDTLSFGWTLTSAPTDSTATITDDTSSTATFTADLAGEYSFELVVNDGTDNSDPLPFTLVATDVANTKPVAVTTTQLFTLAGQPLALDGSQSFDDDGQPLTFRWRLMQKPPGSVILLENANAEVATITPDVDGDYEVELVVNDGIESSDPVTVMITAGALPDNCLVISEYIEGDSNNKAIELYNCDTAPVSLDNISICLVRNGTTSCGSALDLTGTLNPGEVIGVCNSQFDMSQIDAGDCDFTGGAMTFNGDDRLVVFEDINMDGQFDFGDVVLDAFGEISQDPVGREWEDTTYRRCNLLPYDGMSMPFDVTAFYDDFFANDYSDFGLPPAPGVMCGAPPVNRAPVADAGPARNITEGQSITLDGSGSSDPDNDVITFLWSMAQRPMGSMATLDDTMIASPSFTADVQGDYVLELVVNDGNLDSQVASVTITALPPITPGTGCVLISEVIEGDSNNKAIELYNCGTGAVSLDEINICLISNGNMACTSQTTLQLMGQLPAGEVVGICNSSINMSLLDAGDCDYTSSVTNFNGNDRLLLYRDNDDNGEFDGLTDEILDAFGETTVDPGKIWEDKTYRRCDLVNTYNGMGAFDVASYYVDTMMIDDFADFGDAPAAGTTCP